MFSWGWGGSFFSGGGALGHGDTDDVPTPALVEALEGTEVVAIASGGQHGAALDADGGVWIWGCGEYGVMGDTGASDELAPVRCEFFDDEDGGAHIDVVQVLLRPLASDDERFLVLLLTRDSPTHSLTHSSTRYLFILLAPLRVARWRAATPSRWRWARTARCTRGAATTRGSWGPPAACPLTCTRWRRT